MGGSWTAKELEKAKELWLSGMSATQVALKLGKTRGSVVGKMKRLKLLRKDTGLPHPVTKNVSSVKQPERRPIKPARPKVVVRHSLNPVTLIDLKPQHCRAILGDVGKDGFAFYCADPKAEGSSYCAYHTGRFTQPPNQRPHYGQAGQRK